MKIRNLVIPAALLLAGGLYLKFGMRGDVDGAEARKLVADGARLIDVRSPEEFADGHLPGALNIPVGTLAARMGDVGPKEAPIVLYCRSGARSSRAARLLREHGFSHVRNLGPMGAW